MASFDGATFKELSQDGRFAVWSKAATIVVKKVPGGDLNVIQVIGQALPRLTMPIACSASELTALYGKRGNEATLVFSYESTTARLESIAPPALAAVGSDLYFTSLSFIRSSGAITSAPTAL